MSGDKQRLSVGLERAEVSEFASLARRCTSTPQLLGVHTVRQALAAARGGAAPAPPPHDAAEGLHGGPGLVLFLDAADAGELAAIATKYSTTPGALARAAVRQTLAAARAGALPMLKPLEPAPASAAPRYERDTWEDATDHNFAKARMILGQLHTISKSGLNAAAIAALKELEEIATIKPPR